MKQWEIWMETGEGHLLGTYEGETFDDAVRAYNKAEHRKNGSIPAKKVKLTYADSQIPRQYWTVWGCRLFDNREDALSGFG